MKNKTQLLDQRNQTKIPDWLFHEDEEDDFLLGKNPSDIKVIDDDEE
jgi:hypothetical protein